MSMAKEFGAVGDGVADDTDALEHAIRDGDGVLEFSRGTYRISRPLVFDLARTGTCGIRGDQGTARIVMTAPGPAFDLIGDHNGTADPASVLEHTWLNERFPIVSGVEILGAHPEADGIRLRKTMQTTIHNVLIRECRYGIHLVERNRNFILSSSHIYNGGDSGVFFDHCNLHQTNLLANHISYNKRAGIRFLNGDPHNVQIVGNDIEYNSGAEGPSAEILLEAPETVISEFTIQGNTIQATREAGGANILILGKKGDPPEGVRLVTITGNVIGARHRNIEIHHGQRINITGNTLYDGTDRNLHLVNCWNTVVGSNTIHSRPAIHNPVTTDGISLVGCGLCTLIGNILNDCRLGSQVEGGAITLSGCDSVAVVSCQIIDSAYRGIYLADSKRCRISENSVYHRSDSPTAIAAIELAQGCRDNFVGNNLVRNGTLGGILDPTSQNLLTGTQELPSSP